MTWGITAQMFCLLKLFCLLLLVKESVCLCVCVCVCVCVYVCVRACERACVRACVRACMRACVCWLFAMTVMPTHGAGLVSVSRSALGIVAEGLIAEQKVSWLMKDLCIRRQPKWTLLIGMEWKNRNKFKSCFLTCLKSTFEINYENTESVLLFCGSNLYQWHHELGGSVCQKYPVHYKPALFCSSVVKSNPTWLCPEELKLKGKQKRTLYKCW